MTYMVTLQGDIFIDRLLLLPPPVGQFCKGKMVSVTGGWYDVYDYNYRVPINHKRNSMTSETSFSQAKFPSF